MVSVPPIILASGSASRRTMLGRAGVAFTVLPANIDESAIIQHHQTLTPTELAQTLAREKARFISAQKPDALVIGSDQILEFDGQILSKAKDIKDAEKKLKALRGAAHILHSAVSVFLDGRSVFDAHDQAHLTMRNFEDDFLAHYMAVENDALTSCVGAYKIEGFGAWLFAEVKGDTFTIMGMPLFPLLGFLHETYGVLPCTMR